MQREEETKDLTIRGLKNDTIQGLKLRAVKFGYNSTTDMLRQVLEVLAAPFVEELEQVKRDHMEGENA